MGERSNFFNGEKIMTNSEFLRNLVRIVESDQLNNLPEHVRTPYKAAITETAEELLYNGIDEMKWKDVSIYISKKMLASRLKDYWPIYVESGANNG